MPVEKIIRIAIIDDDEDDFFFLKEYIGNIEGKRFEISWFRDFETGFQQVLKKSHDVYFVDYFLGSATGLDLLKEASRIGFDRPVVLLTGFGNKDIDIRAMESGATDYLVKSELNTEKVERCIRYALERSQILHQLKTREARYRNLFEGSKDAVFITDTSLRFLEVNRSATSFFETSDGTLENKSLYDFIEEEIKSARIRDLVKSSGRIDDLEIRIKRVNDIRVGLLSLSVLDQPEGEAVVHGIIHDITNIRKAELANLQAEKLEANERLIRILAHEIRNPLNNIILSVEQLLPENENSSQKDFLQIIQRNSIRINNIISELLGLAGPSELVFEELSLEDVVNESLSRASDRIKLHKVSVEKNYTDSSLTISGDKNNLAIALTNILINAIEAMEAGTGKLYVAVQPSAEGPSISIKDNGKGIPKEYLSKLFEPFFTLKKNGMGLGLTASYSIIQSHKANLHVDSKVGEGTNFLITFNNS